LYPNICKTEKTMKIQGKIKWLLDESAKKIKYEDLIGQFDLIMDPIKGLIMSKN
jgi:hypothetical protein